MGGSRGGKEWKNVRKEEWRREWMDTTEPRKQKHRRDGERTVLTRLRWKERNLKLFRFLKER